MSLLWSDEICIFVNHKGVRLVRRSSHWRPTILDKLTIPCTGNTDTAWENQISTLEKIIQEAPWNKGNVTVILSNHFVRYLLIPWNELLLNDNEQKVYVGHLFSETYGDISENFDLRCSPEKPEMTRIASAVDHSFIQRIKETISSAPRLTLKSIKPYLMSVYNSNSNQFINKNGWFVIQEPGRICIVARGLGQWQCIKSIRIGSEWLNEIDDMFSREQLSEYANNIPAHVYLWAPEQNSFPSLLKNNWPIVKLTPKTYPGLSPESDLAYSMMAYD